VVYFRTGLNISWYFTLVAFVILVQTDESKTINRSQKFVFTVLHSSLLRKRDIFSAEGKVDK
jgi:hypothetical protein